MRNACLYSKVKLKYLINVLSQDIDMATFAMRSLYIFKLRAIASRLRDSRFSRENKTVLMASLAVLPATSFASFRLPEFDIRENG